MPTSNSNDIWGGPHKSTMNPNMEDTTHPNSSAYSSLTNSNGDVRNEEDV